MVSSWYNIMPHYPPMLHVNTSHLVLSHFRAKFTAAINTRAALLRRAFLRSTISQRCKFSAPLKARPVRASSNQLRGETTFCSPSKAAIPL